MQQNSDEISFYDVYVNLMKGFYKSWKIIAVLAVVIICFSITYENIITRYYQQDIIIKSKSLTTSDMSYLFDNLKKTVKKQKYQQIGAALGLDSDEVKLIKGLDFDVFASSVNESGAVVTIYFYSGLNCSVLKSSVENYLNNLDYIKSLKMSALRKYSGIISDIDDELEVLHLAFNESNLNLQNSEGFVKKSEIVMSLKEKKKDVQYHMETDVPVVVVESFCDSKNSTGPSFLINLLISTIIFFSLSVFIIVLSAALFKH